MRTGVLKIGGASLFSEGIEFDQLRSYVQVIQSDPINRWFVLLGGGDTVESMRTIHRNHPQLDSSRMHWRCVELLRATWDAAAELLQFDRLIETLQDLDVATSKQTPGCYLVEASSFYHPKRLDWVPTRLRPKENWETTSDTLAWLLALRLRADELRLIKKPDCSKVESLDQAARLGLVDPQIATLSRNQPTNWKLDTVMVYHNQNWMTKTLRSRSPQPT